MCVTLCWPSSNHSLMPEAPHSASPSVSLSVSLSVYLSLPLPLCVCLYLLLFISRFPPLRLSVMVFQ